MKVGKKLSNRNDYVYCGGRFDFDYQEEEYIKKAAQDYRAILMKDVSLLLKSTSPVPLSSHSSYVGPFYFETDGMIDQDIVEAEMHQIEKCTVVVFLLDNCSCPGTIAEMVYAASLRKRMAIVYLEEESETESILHSSWWYPIILCQKGYHSEIELIPYKEHDEGRDKILKYLQDLI